ncbi:TRAP transporter substrate-binding protein DctP [Paradesulfitobacterium ferrireducens]|uniref:TRAP transporter substrate-binding protein DctP n=1 Tax=Paradesulfitobacterium ferrireducens TaxID=2816476 RepID=UPI001A8C7222|nr:TRAP transporter substrate-binding protein DctP [Paradesulfitobacterium ferrireducens]
MLKKKRMISIMITGLLLFLALTGCGSETKAPAEQQAKPKTITLKIHSAWAENNAMNFHLKPFIEKAEKKSNGTLKIVWGGGPEAIPAFQLAEAVKNGMVDIAWTAHTYNVSHIPVLEGVKLATYDAEGLRTSGGFEFIDKLYQEKLNTHLLGNFLNGLTYNLYTTKKKIESLDDFKGMTIRTTPAYQAFVEGLGAAVVNTAPGEVYQALERNVVQGYGWPSVGIVDFGWHEVTGYVIDPAFYSVDGAALVSDKVWKTLSEQQKTALTDAMKEIEKEAKEYYKNKISEERKTIEKAGVKTTALSGELAEKYLKIAYDKGWEKVEKSAPQDAAKLRELITKK